jgi:hypothetical protein
MSTVRNIICWAARTPSAIHLQKYTIVHVLMISTHRVSGFSQFYRLIYGFSVFLAIGVQGDWARQFETVVEI